MAMISFPSHPPENETTKKNDTESFIRLYGQHRDKLVAYALKALGNELYAQDVVQDVFLKVWKMWSNGASNTIQGEEYLYKAVKNMILDLSKKDTATMKYLTYLRKIFTEVDHQEDGKLQSKETIKCVNDEIERLSSRRKAVLRIIMERDDQHSELAKELGMSQENFNATLKTARKMLRSNLATRHGIIIMYILLFAVNSKNVGE